MAIPFQKSTNVNDVLYSKSKTIFIHITKDIYQTLSVFDLGLVIVQLVAITFLGLDCIANGLLRILKHR